MRRPFSWGCTIRFIRAPSDTKFVPMSCANCQFKVIFINIKNAFKKKTVPKLGIKREIRQRKLNVKFNCQQQNTRFTVNLSTKILKGPFFSIHNYKERYSLLFMIFLLGQDFEANLPTSFIDMVLKPHPNINH